MVDRLAYVRAGIETAVEAMSQSFMTGRLERIADFYTADAMIISYQYNKLSSVVTGLSAIKKAWQSISSPIYWQLTISQLIDASDSLCHIGRSTMCTYANGHDHLSEEDVILLWQKQMTGDYKISLMSRSPATSAAESRSEGQLRNFVTLSSQFPYVGQNYGLD